MDVQPYQTPPRWWSPMLHPGWVHFWKWIRERIRVKHHRLMDIEIRGMENLSKCIDQKQGVLITPNHSCHADPTVVYGTVAPDDKKANSSPFSTPPRPATPTRSATSSSKARSPICGTRARITISRLMKCRPSVPANSI